MLCKFQIIWNRKTIPPPTVRNVHIECTSTLHISRTFFFLRTYLYGRIRSPYTKIFISVYPYVNWGINAFEMISTGKHELFNFYRRGKGRVRERKKKHTNEFQQLYLLFTRIYKIGIINTLMDLRRFVGFVCL